MIQNGDILSFPLSEGEVVTSHEYLVAVELSEDAKTRNAASQSKELRQGLQSCREDYRVNMFVLAFEALAHKGF